VPGPAGNRLAAGAWARLPKPGKRALVASGALAGALVLAALTLAYLVDLDAWKPRVEAAASRALAMDVTVEGGLHAAFAPGLHLSLDKVRVRHRGSQVLFAERADLAIDLLPLLQRRLHYSRITLDRARVSLERGLDGRYNIQKPPGEAADFHAMDLARLSIPVLAVDYVDRMTGDAFESADCTAEFTRMRHPGGAPLLMRLSVDGQLACGELRGKQSKVDDLRLSLAATDGVYEFKPVTMRAFGGQGSGSLRMDRSGPVPELALEYSLAGLRIEDVLKSLPPGKSIHGRMDFSTALAMRGRVRADFRRTATGTMSLAGTDLTLAGTDLDERISKFEASQDFNLFDVSAVLLAGPLGLVVTKGYEFSRLGVETGGHTAIRTLVSRWKVENGVARAVDVAMATGAHRLALTGGLDFVDDEFDEVYVSLVDEAGCSKARLRIRGTLGKPRVEKPGLAASAAGPVVNLVDKARTLLSGTRIACEVAYRGSVAPPQAR
jgi:AsmA protein